MQLSSGREGKRRRFGPVIGLGLLGLGILLLLGVGAFFIYSWRANSGLDKLFVPAPTEEPTRTASAPSQAPGASSQGFSPEIIAAQRIFPGEAVPPVFWPNPMEAEAGYAPVNPSVPEFVAVPPGQGAARHSLPVPVRITIPAIDLDSEVISLRILDLGNSLEYETPKNVVGHIPETANAGEDGTAWFFGHLESPIQGEGNVFADLPKIPDLLRSGPVYATVANGESTFLYKLTASRVIHEDSLIVYDSGRPGISLVTCVPRFLYNHRLVVTGELEGVKGSVEDSA